MPLSVRIQASDDTNLGGSEVQPLGPTNGMDGHLRCPLSPFCHDSSFASPWTGPAVVGSFALAKRRQGAISTIPYLSLGKVRVQAPVSIAGP